MAPALAFAASAALPHARPHRAPRSSPRTAPRTSPRAAPRTAHPGNIYLVASSTRVRVQRRGRDSLSVEDGLRFAERLARYAQDDRVPAHVAETLHGWHSSYTRAMRDSLHVPGDPDAYSEDVFTTLVELVRLELERPWPFEPFHASAREPFDYYKFGLDFATTLVDTGGSRVVGKENILKARAQIEAGENVVFLGNHQSEADPVAIDILFDWIIGLDREFCENLIFMAGDRVRDDPVVAPFTIGRNLLTVYSKKHINDVPELKSEKLTHNRRTISTTVSLFNKGGHCIWFAPSGGRDRRSKETGQIDLSPFDADALDVMRLTAEKSSRPTHFYPMALVSHTMLPPLESVGGAKLGEVRTCSYAPLRMSVGEEIDWASSDIGDKAEGMDKVARRRARAKYAEKCVRDGYLDIGGLDL